MRSWLPRFVLACAVALAASGDCTATPVFANGTHASTRSSTRVATNSTIAPATSAALDIMSLGTPTGAETGGTSVTINGAGLTGATSVTFGGVNATSFTVNSSTLITATAPAVTFALSSTAASNAVNVVVTGPGGTDTLTGAYTYTSRAKELAGSLYHNEWRASDPAITVVSGNVSDVPDFNGNGTLAQATSGSRPSFQATGFNGGPGIRTTGTPGKWMQATMSSTIASGRRPYVFVVMQVASGSAAFWEISSGAGEATFWEMQRGPSGTWRFYLQPSSFSATTDTGADSNTGVMVVEGGNTTGGTNAFVIDGTGANNSRTGTIGTAVSTFTLFGEYNGASVSGANSTTTVAYVLILNNEPDATLKSNLRAFLTGSNFPGYTSNKLKP